MEALRDPSRPARSAVAVHATGCMGVKCGGSVAGLGTNGERVAAGGWEALVLAPAPATGAAPAVPGAGAGAAATGAGGTGAEVGTAGGGGGVAPSVGFMPSTRATRSPRAGLGGLNSCTTSLCCLARAQSTAVRANCRQEGQMEGHTRTNSVTGRASAPGVSRSLPPPPLGRKGPSLPVLPQPPSTLTGPSTTHIVLKSNVGPSSDEGCCSVSVTPTACPDQGRLPSSVPTAHRRTRLHKAGHGLRVPIHCCSTQRRVSRLHVGPWGGGRGGGGAGLTGTRTWGQPTGWGHGVNCRRWRRRHHRANEPQSPQHQNQNSQGQQGSHPHPTRTHARTHQGLGLQ
jgi:hypothetical protein